MSGSFVKIYSSILRSSIWQEPASTKIVWITLLALADGEGVVESSVPGLAAHAGVTLEECELALGCLLAPDKYSGSKVDEGRRVREVRGGWVIINHGYYREFRTPKQVRDANRIAGRRAAARVTEQPQPIQPEGDMSPASPTVRDVAPEAEAEAERERSSDSPSAKADTRDALSEPGPDVRAAAAKTNEAVKAVFEYWQAEHGKQRSRFDRKRAALIKARLSEGFSVEQLCQAIRGARREPWLMGRDPRASRTYNGLETLLREAAQVERLIELEEGAGGKAPTTAPEEETWLT